MNHQGQHISPQDAGKRSLAQTSVRAWGQVPGLQSARAFRVVRDYGMLERKEVTCIIFLQGYKQRWIENSSPILSYAH